jgi:hypothetical protein
MSGGSAAAVDLPDRRISRPQEEGNLDFLFPFLSVSNPWSRALLMDSEAVESLCPGTMRRRARRRSSADAESVGQPSRSCLCRSGDRFRDFSCRRSSTKLKKSASHRARVATMSRLDPDGILCWGDQVEHEPGYQTAGMILLLGRPPLTSDELVESLKVVRMVWRGDQLINA